MAYKLTPEQYKDAARNRVSNKNTAENTNSAVSAYARALNARRALDNKNRSDVTQNTPAVQSNNDDQADGNWLTRTLSTVAAPAIRLVEGAAKFVENAVLDLGASLAAGALDLVGADDTAKNVQSWAAQDVIGEMFDWEPIEEIYRNSYSNEWGSFGEILQEGIYSVGQQAIPLALNLLTGGTAGTALSMGSFAMGAYGSGFESASQDGGSVLGSSAYGLISAGIETGIESLFGALGGNKMIKEGIEKATLAVAKSETGQQIFRFLLDNVVGEGLEEVASGMVENYIQAMTYKGDYSSVESYFNNILSAPPATQEELWEQFILGAFAGGLMGGGARIITKASPMMNTAETIQEIDELKEKGYNLSMHGKDTAATETQLVQKESELMERVNKNFDRFTQGRKTGNTADGILSYMEQNFNADESGRFISSKNALIHSENASYGIGQAELDDALGTHGKLHEGAFEGDALISKQKVEKALKNINAGLGRSRLKVVFADMSDAQDYGYIKKNVIVVNAAHLGTQLEFKVTENGNVTTYKADAGLSTLLHEVLHFTDDTKAGKQLQELLNKYATEQQTDALVDTVANVLDATKNKEGFDFDGELSARQLEHLLFNENIINRLTEDNSSLSKRILNKATRLLNALKGKNLRKTKELRTLLNKTVKLYNKAIAQAGKGKRIISKGVDKEAAQPRHSIRVIDGKEIVVIDTDQDIFEGKEKSDYPKIVRQYMVKKFRGKVLNVGENKTYINRDQLEEYTFPANRRLDEDIKAAKMKAGTELDNLLKVATYIGHIEDDGRHPEAVRGWDKYATRFVVDNQMFEAEISIELVARGDLFYDMTKIKNITPDSRRSMSPTTSQSDVVERKPSTNSISEENENVNSFDENSSENVSKDDIRRSRRIVNTDELTRSIDDAIEMLIVAGNINAEEFDVSAKKKSLAEKHLSNINNLAAKGRLREDSKAVRSLIEDIFNSAVMKEQYAEEITESVMALDILRKHIHSIDLTTDSIKPEIQKEYGKSNNIFRLWSKKGGVAWDTAVQEIVEELPHLQKDSDRDTLFNIFNTYTKCVADIKQVRIQVKEFIKDADEAKRLMARSLVLSLSERGTELITKVTADKLQTAIAEERNALRDTLRAVKNGNTEISFAGENVSATVQKQLQTVLDLVAKERAQAYAAQRAQDIVFHLKKGVTGEELSDLRKAPAYQELESYIAERYLNEGKEISIKSIEHDNRGLVQELKWTVSTIQSIHATEESNFKALEKFRASKSEELKAQPFKKLKLQLETLAADQSQVEALKQLETSILSFEDKKDYTTNALFGLVKAFNNYFKKENPLLFEMVESTEYEQIMARTKDILEYLEKIEDYDNLSLEEKELFQTSISHFLGDLYRSTRALDTVILDGKEVSAQKHRDKLMRRLESSVHRNPKGGLRSAERTVGSMFKNFLGLGMHPEQVTRMAECYSGGLEAQQQEIHYGWVRGNAKRLELEKMLADFGNDEKNKIHGKKYFDYLKKTYVEIQSNGGKYLITREELLETVLILRQSDGFRHANAGNPKAEGIYFDDIKNCVTNQINERVLKFTIEDVGALEELLSETDKRYINVVTQYLILADKLRAEIGEKIYGFSRSLGAEYFPVITDKAFRDQKRANKNLFFNMLDSSGHLSMNQRRTNGLVALRVRGVNTTLNGYSKQIGLYYGVSVPIADFLTIYYGRTANGRSLCSYIEEFSMKGYEKYITQYLLDVQGANIPTNSFLEKHRIAWSVSKVFLNFKVLWKQLTGIWALGGELKWKSLAYGVSHSAKVFNKANREEMYKYSLMAQVRFADNHATLAEFNVEDFSGKIGKLMRVFGKAIEGVDMYTAVLAWEGCKHEIGAIGGNAHNPEYLEKAAKRFEEVMNTTDRYEMTKRSALSRSSDAYLRSQAGFKSSSISSFTLLTKYGFGLMQSFYEKKHLPERIEIAKTDKKLSEEELERAKIAYEKAKKNGDKKAVGTAECLLKQAQATLKNETLRLNELIDKNANIDKVIKRNSVGLGKNIVAISLMITSAAFIEQLFSNLRGDKEDEEWDEDFLWGMLDDSLSSVFAMIPFADNLYNSLEFNWGTYEKKSYDASFWVIDDWNAFKTAFNGIQGLMDGTGTKTVARVARDWAYFLGQWFGIPIKNAFTLMNGVLKISPKTKYMVDNWFYESNYSSDLTKAVKAGDTELADTIVRLMMKDTFGDTDTTVTKTVRSLYEQGYSGILPKTVSSSIKINGESYSMTAKQQKAFKAIYSQADTTIQRLVGKQSFTKLSAKVQADSIKWIYDYYYEKAKEDLSGIEDDSKKATFAKYIPIETLAVAYCEARSLESDKDKQGNAISGTKKAKVVKYLNSIRASAAEKYMILGYLGYAPVSSQAKVLITAFARKNGATEAEIEELLKLCNIQV